MQATMPPHSAPRLVRRLPAAALGWAVLILPLHLAAAAELAGTAPAAHPLRALHLTSGGHHDYATLGPFLATELGKLVGGTVEWKQGLGVLEDPAFADGYDAVIYNVCDDEAPGRAIDNVLAATAGRPPGTGRGTAAISTTPPGAAPSRPGSASPCAATVIPSTSPASAGRSTPPGSTRAAGARASAKTGMPSCCGPSPARGS